MTHTYPAIFTPEPNGWSVEFPGFDLATCGDDEADALYMAKDALVAYLYDYRRDGLPFPPAQQPHDPDARQITITDTDFSIVEEVHACSY